MVNNKNIPAEKAKQKLSEKLCEVKEEKSELERYISELAEKNKDLERKNSKLTTKLKIVYKVFAIVSAIFILSYCSLILWFYLNKPADYTSNFNSIQSRLDLIDSKRDYRIISRDLWADEELNSNKTDLKPLLLPVTGGVIAHHTDELRCFTIGELKNKNCYL